MAEVGNAGGANTWGAHESGNRGLGKLRRLEDSGVWEVREIGRLGRFGRLGDSGELEIREIGENQYMWQKLRTSWNPGELGRLGDSGDSGDSEDSGDPGDSGDSGDWEVREIRETGANHYM